MSDLTLKWTFKTKNIDKMVATLLPDMQEPMRKNPCRLCALYEGMRCLGLNICRANSHNEVFVTEDLVNITLEKSITPEGYTEVVKAVEAALCENRYSLLIYLNRYIEKNPDGVYTKAFIHLLNGDKPKLKLE